MKTLNLSKRRDGSLIPETEEDAIVLEQMAQGETWCFSVHRERNAKHHRKFFSLIRVVWDNLPEVMDDHYPDIEHLRAEITMKAGHFTTFTTTKGERVYLPKSIAFDKMDQTEFDAFYSKCVDIILKHFLPVEREDLLDFLIGEYA